MTITRADLTDRLRDQLHRLPHRPLISEDGRSSTGGEVLELVETKIVEYRRAAVGTHARVGIIGRTALDFVTDLYAVFALDAAAVPLPRTLTTWALPRYADLAGLTHLSAPNDASLSLGHPVTTVGRRQLTANPAIQETDNHAAAAVQLISGTTGKQLVAARSASALLVEAENYIHSFNLTSGGFIRCPVPIHHAYGFGLCALAAPLAGTPVTYLSAKHPKLLRHALNRQQVTLFASVPPMLRILAELGNSTPMRCVTAGMPLDARSAGLVGTRIAELGQVYGTTETGPIRVRAPQDWRRTCRRRLSPPKLPQLFEHAAELTTTETGKVRRPKTCDQS